MVRDRRIGPHEGHEFELLDRGKKHVAFFHDIVPREYTEFKEKADFDVIEWQTEHKTKSDTIVIPYRILFRKTHVRDAERLHEILTNFDRHNWEALERETGQILGYSKAEIDFYIKSLKRMTHKRA